MKRKLGNIRLLIQQENIDKLSSILLKPGTPVINIIDKKIYCVAQIHKSMYFKNNYNILLYSAENIISPYVNLANITYQEFNNKGYRIANMNNFKSIRYELFHNSVWNLSIIARTKHTTCTHLVFGKYPIVQLSLFMGNPSYISISPTINKKIDDIDPYQCERASLDYCKMRFTGLNHFMELPI